ncbi:MAG: helix-turn-helix transcriptional regulator [Pararhodobacter sp.]|nr:helix-turn-helix transcriptional regulator [Pararhodobacter sp.]
MPNLSPSIEHTFVALSDPTRRAVVQALSNGPATVSELASPFAMALPSFTQHLGVLESAGLIVSRKEGRRRICSLNPQALQDAEGWLAENRRQWEVRFDRFEAHLETVKKEAPNE